MKLVGKGKARILCAALSAAGLFMVRSAAAQVTFTIDDPTDDAFVRAAAPALGYGSAGALNVTGPSASQGRFDTMLKYDATPAVQAFNSAFGAGNWAISSVQLRVTEDGSPNNPIFHEAVGTFEVRWQSNDNWVEGAGTPNVPAIAAGNEICWNYLQTLLAAGSEASLGTFGNNLHTGPHTYTLSSDRMFLADLTNGSPVSLHLQPVSSNIGFTFNSHNNPFTSNHPRLIITAVPEPAGLALLMAGTLALARRR